MTDNNNDKIKCTRCKVNLPKAHFDSKRSGDLLKQCRQCNQKAKEYRSKNPKSHPKCEHNRNRSNCKECKELNQGGGSICEHYRQKSRCKECKELNQGGASICEHNRRRIQCSECKSGLLIGEKYKPVIHIQSDRFSVSYYDDNKCKMDRKDFKLTRNKSLAEQKANLFYDNVLSIHNARVKLRNKIRI